MAVGEMKYFACQPSRPNSFGLLVGHTLTYLATRRGPVETASTTASKATVGASDGEETLNLCVQHTVTLPHVFGSAPKCFCMASSSYYGGDAALVGGDNGVLGVVLMHDGSISYAPGRSPDGPSDGSRGSIVTTSVLALSSATRGFRTVKLHGLAPPLRTVAGASSILPLPQPVPAVDGGVGTVTWIQDSSLVFVGFKSGHVEWYRVTIGAQPFSEEDKDPKSFSAGVTGRATSSWCTEGGFSSLSGVQYRKDVCGNRCGRKDDVSQIQLLGRCAGNSFVNICCYYSGSYSAEAGGFVSSDYFPACGHVVAGAERALYVFNGEQPDAPLYYIPSLECTYLSCHPFLPLVALLSCGGPSGRGHDIPIDDEDIVNASCKICVYQWTNDSGMFPVASSYNLVPDGDSNTFSGLHLSCSWSWSSEPRLAVCNIKDSSIQLFYLLRINNCAQNMSTETTTLSSVGSASNYQYHEFVRERELHFPLCSLVNAEFLLPGARERASWAASPLTHVFVPGDGGIVSRGRLDRPLPNDFSTASKLSAPPTVAREMIPHCVERMQGSQVRGSDVAACFAVPSANTLPHLIVVNTVGEIVLIPLPKEVKMAFWSPSDIVVGVGPAVCTIRLPTSRSDVSGNHVEVSGEEGAFCSQHSLKCCGPETLCRNQGTSDSLEVANIEEHMGKRLAAGFGVSATANIEALAKMKDPSPYGMDEHVLFSYVAIMEKVGLVSCSGPVPSVMELLTLSGAPNTTQLTDMGLLPQHTAVVCRSSTSQNDPRRLLLLHLLNWIPSQDTPTQHGLPRYSTREDVERAAVVDVLHRHRLRAAMILRQHHHMDQNYPVVAGLIESYDVVVGVMNDCMLKVRDRFLQHLSPWLRIIFTSDVNRSEIYETEALPFWDRVAVALILEHDTVLLVETFRSIFSPQCNMIQHLILFGGISSKTCPLMQAIIDCTGDFQLGACLYARIGVPAVALGQETVSGVRSAPSWESGRSANASQTDSSQDPPEKKADPAVHCWTLWSNTYRVFLSNKQEFVKRTLFDLQCKQCRDSSQLKEGEMHSKLASVPQKRGNIDTMGNSPATSQLHLSGGRRCSVCCSFVRLEPLPSEGGFVLCAVCGHGGHMQHLRAWFTTHRKCAVAGCGCHCEADGGAF